MSQPPNLETEAGRAAYRAELRKVALPLRFTGLGLIVAAALVVFAISRDWVDVPEGAIVVGYGMLAAGWALVIATTLLRNRHHRRRMAELEGVMR